MVNQDRLPSTFSDDDWQAVKEHTAVAYILSPPLTKETAQFISGDALAIIALLFENGATAVQSESAGLAHGKQEWEKLAADYCSAKIANDGFNTGATLYNAWVQRGIYEKHTSLMYTLGLQLLGHPDVEVLTANEKPKEDIEWADLLGLYLMADRPERPLLDGQGFRLHSGKRRIIKLTPCMRKAEDDFQFNPYGYYRLMPETWFEKLKRSIFRN